ncbi:MAG: hypothetical protein K0Q79_3398 [Flavipsychrobacter sp.]|jgi:hypothetical protein|nr:hypothetical protein [Flavipsychrobacter sp.]
MRVISDLTYKIVAFSVIEDFKMDESVDWAIEMLRLGYETPSLLIVAGLTKPVIRIEGEEYLKAALKELNIKQQTGDNAIVCYSYYCMQKIAVLDNIRMNLQDLFSLNIYNDYPRSIYDFYLLYWAWDDFDYGSDWQHYWESATKENIQDIIVEKAKEWLKIHEVETRQLFL